MNVTFYRTKSKFNPAVMILDENKKDFSAGIAEGSYIPELSAIYFNRLYIKPEYRHKGLGSKLLDAFLEEIDELRLPLILDINPYGEMTYQELEEFYIRHGFKLQIEDNSFIYHGKDV